MPGLNDFIVRFIGDNKPLATTIAKTEADLARLGSSATGAGQKMGAFGNLAGAAFGNLEVVAVAAGATIAVASFKAAAAFETAHAQLRTAARAVGEELDHFSGEIAKADGQMVGLGFTTTETESAIAKLTIPTGDVATATQLMGVAADFARARHISLADATAKLVRIEAGRFRGLAEIGVSSEGLTKTQAGIEEATRRVTEAVKGQSDAFAKTAEGSIAVMHARIQQLEVQLGQGLIPVIKATSESIGELSGALDFANKHTDNFVSTLGKGALSHNPFFFFQKGLDETKPKLTDAEKHLADLTKAGQDVGDAFVKFGADSKQYKDALEKLGLVEGRHSILSKDIAKEENAAAAAMKAANAAARAHARGIYSLGEAYALLGANINNNVVGSIKNFNTAAHATLDAQVASRQAGQDLLTTIASMSGAQDDAASSTTTAAQAMFDQIGKVNALRDAQQGASDSTYELAKAQQDNQKATQDAKNVFNDYQRVLHGYSSDTLKAGTASENLSKAKLSLKSANLNITDSERNLTAARRTQDPAKIARAEIQLSEAKLAAKDASRDAAEAQRIYNGTLHGFSANSAEARAAHDKLTAAQDTAHQSVVALREAYDSVHDSAQDVKHAQLDLKGAFDSTTSSAKKTRASIDDVVTSAITAADRLSEQRSREVGGGPQGLIAGFKAELDLLTGLAVAVPGLGHAFDEVISNLRTDISFFSVSSRKAVFRAAGGPLNAGQLSVVGEHGPELFVPRQSGTVIPNGTSVGHTTTISPTIVVSELDSGDRLVRKVITALSSGQGLADLRRVLG